MRSVGVDRAGRQVAGGTEPIELAIGRGIRAARKRAKLPMTELAARCGISQPYLSQLENGKASPSINTLYGIANALGLSPQDLLPGSGDEPLVVRSGAIGATPIEDRADAALARVLVGSPGRGIQAQEVVVELDQYLGGWFEHSGEELVYIVDGAVGVELDGRAPELLGAGDAMWYRATTPHRWSLTGSEPARILVVSAAMPEHRAHR